MRTADDFARASAVPPFPLSRHSRERSPLGAMLRPAVGFERPDDVLKDPDLTLEEKRAVLASWASDACAVADRPGWRRLPGSETEVPMLEIMDARRRLDGRPSLAAPHGDGQVRPAGGPRRRRAGRSAYDLTLEEHIASWRDQQEVLRKIAESARAIPNPPEAVRRIAETARGLLDQA